MEFPAALGLVAVGIAAPATIERLAAITNPLLQRILVEANLSPEPDDDTTGKQFEAHRLVDTFWFHTEQFSDGFDTTQPHDAPPTARVTASALLRVVLHFLLHGVEREGSSGLAT